MCVLCVSEGTETVSDASVTRVQLRDTQVLREEEAQITQAKKTLTRFFSKGHSLHERKVGGWVWVGL